jgi:hypothetical protein
MRRTTSIGIVLSLMLVAVAPTRAADLGTKAGRHVKVSHHVRSGESDRQALPGVAVSPRNCDWIGPGGRAIYRCGLDRGSALNGGQAFRVAQNDAPPQRICAWVGPGGRASYHCGVH